MGDTMEVSPVMLGAGLVVVALAFALFGFVAGGSKPGPAGKKKKGGANPEAKKPEAKKDAPKAKDAPKPKEAPKAKEEPKEVKAETKAKGKKVQEPVVEDTKKGAGKKKGKAAATPEVDHPKTIEELRPQVKVDDDEGEWNVVGVVQKKGKKASTQKATPPPPVIETASAMPTNKKNKEAPPPGAAVAAAPAPAAVVEPEEAPKIKGVQVISTKMVGRVVGPGGATLKEIQELTGTQLNIAQQIADPAKSVVTITAITGGDEGLKAARHAVDELTTKGFFSLSYGADFVESSMQVHPTYFPEFIGIRGAVIQKIQEELNTHLVIPSIPPKEAQDMKKKMKVGICGPKDGVRKAKEIIQAITECHHHDLTHPNMVHKELDIEPAYYNVIIGVRGSQIKHIQQNYKIKVFIPNEHTQHRNVMLVGEQKGVDAAAANIYRSIENWDARASAKNSRWDAGGSAEGDWAEEPHEDWMDQYLYKRK